MNSKEELVCILVHLSIVDKMLADSEKEMIHHLGEQQGLTPERVDELINNPPPIKKLSSMTSEDNFDYLKTIIQLMKVDKKVFRSEIAFCEKMAMRLGYLPGVVAEMSAYIYSDPNISTNREILLEIADKHVMKRNKDYD